MDTIVRAGMALALTAAAGSSMAHISYTGRNFGTLVSGSNQAITNQAVTGNYGWADAADSALVFDANLAFTRDVALAGLAAAGKTTESVDALTYGVGTDNLYLGDSHKSRAFRFHLDSTLTVSFTVAANPGATATSVGGLLPGFSVYQGLAAVAPFTAPQTSADYDFNVASQAWRSSFAQAAAGATYGYGATQGSWNAKGNWSIGGDGDLAGSPAALSNFRFVGYGEDGDRNGVATATLTLGPGDYSVFVGGDDIANKGTTGALRAYGMSVTVSAVPEPHAALLLLAGLPLLLVRCGFVRRT